jgi:hypothetical protein
LTIGKRTTSAAGKRYSRAPNRTITCPSRSLIPSSRARAGRITRSSSTSQARLISAFSSANGTRNPASSSVPSTSTTTR